jgi:hypothetical protein
MTPDHAAIAARASPSDPGLDLGENQMWVMR